MLLEDPPVLLSRNVSAGHEPVEAGVVKVGCPVTDLECKPSTVVGRQPQLHLYTLAGCVGQSSIVGVECQASQRSATTLEGITTDTCRMGSIKGKSLYRLS